MIENWRWLRRAIVNPSLVIAAVLSLAAQAGAESVKPHASLWFDPTQLPSFIGAVERYLPNPDGRPDRLVFKEGSQIVFPPEVIEAVQRAAPAGQPLVVWGIRARNAPIITMLAFAVPDGEATVLDRFYWRPEHSGQHGGNTLRLGGTVKAPYFTPQGEVSGAILDDGSVIRVDPAIAVQFKDRFVEKTKLAGEGLGSESQLGKAIDAESLGASLEKLQPLPRPDMARPAARN